ncbi:hypothetical protein QTG56_23370 (plasmid) [Rossellomorea sp. AcN35-11]|nr:hypothetical protein [Rossellomorea aquimaris]WJV32305.1 hypothetical protein QTG56_23370 [Rossellomorea sp. AcN35-11]
MKKISSIFPLLMATTFIIGFLSMFIKDVFLNSGESYDFFFLIENIGLGSTYLIGITMMIYIQIANKYSKNTE